MVLEKLSLEGKVAIVTGGGTGVGRGIALALARAGAHIVVAARRPEFIEATARDARALGRKGLAVQTDITRSDQVNRLVERTLAEMGRVDILVNNAGIVREETRKALWEISDEEWHSSLDTNFTGAFYCCRAVGPHMSQQRSGKVVNVASMFGMRGVRDNYMYNSAKAATITFTQCLALSWAYYGINVNCIAPGLFQTWRDKADYDFLAAYVPLKRAGQPEGIGPPAVFLASEASNYLTGSVIPVDGGSL
ncbi:MAG: SDR family oxidoreductase, partial [Chloroflexota bacterium]|nr:SDR family oxidoreductase [Chloroflexota bacterium]